MGALDVNGLDKAIDRLSRLSNMSKVTAIAKKAVKAAQPINERATRAALASVEYGPYSTGGASESVASTNVHENQYGVYTVARPTGYDDRGIRNGTKAAMLQYGGANLPARPWLEKAVAAAEGECFEVMEEMIREEMELE